MAGTQQRLHQHSRCARCQGLGGPRPDAGRATAAPADVDGRAPAGTAGVGLTPHRARAGRSDVPGPDVRPRGSEVSGGLACRHGRHAQCHRSYHTARHLLELELDSEWVPARDFS